MAARFTDLAVDALADYLAANYGTYLDEVETELSLTAGSLPDPKAFVRADLPFDNRNPRMDIFDEAADSENDGDTIIAYVECAVVWSSRGDADIVAGELLARRCLTALIKCLWADRQLNNRVLATYFDEPGGVGSDVGEDKITYHLFKQMVTVQLQEDL